MLDLIVSYGKIQVGDDLCLTLDGRPMKSQARRLRDLLPVLYDHGVLDRLSGDTLLYRMFRNAIREDDRGLFRAQGLRYDLTVMAALGLGPEPNKTLGHYHPEVAVSLTYPELYQVLHGKATYLLQRRERGAVTDFVTVEVKKGGALLIPPNYGHVTVNTGNVPLVMANLVSDQFSSLYDEYTEKGGAAYFLMSDGQLVPNRNYGQLPKPRTGAHNFAVAKDLYTDFLSCPSCFSYLTDPTNLGKLGQI